MSAAYVILKAIMKRSTIGWLLIAHISIALASNSGRVIARVRADTPQVTWGATDTANVVPLGGQCGGRDYTGPTTCQLIPDARVECVFINTYYSQCQIIGPTTTATPSPTITSSPCPSPPCPLCIPGHGTTTWIIGSCPQCACVPFTLSPWCVTPKPTCSCTDNWIPVTTTGSDLCPYCSCAPDCPPHFMRITTGTAGSCTSIPWWQPTTTKDAEPTITSLSSF
ncbi:acetyl xylan esterase [Coprinopsis cinerea AmutBmut pab1-1]|nr:acetyl xylan esterase [Coprinopsis cinerea AmutBmut pab1-1]